MRRVELRIAGFEDSVTPNEIVKQVSEHGVGCTAEDVRVGAIRTSRSGLCTVWVQVPAVAGLPLARKGVMDLGWSRCRVALLKSRPLKCFRCLAPGHVQQRCPCPVDRSRCCFNCGEPDHAAAVCRNRPHCPTCAERKRRTDHRPGGTDCAPVGPRRDTRPPPHSLAVAGEGHKQEEAALASRRLPAKSGGRMPGVHWVGRRRGGLRLAPRR